MSSRPWNKCGGIIPQVFRVIRNFTKVANSLNYTPSMISKTIKAMEDDLGVELFIRKPHELSPTQAAHILAGEWRQLLESYDHAIRKMQDFLDLQESTVIVGFVDSSDYVDAFIKQVIADYRNKHPHINIIPEKHDMHRSVELLNFGMVDLALTNEMEMPYLKEHGLEFEILQETKVTAYVPESNPLFERDSVDFKDLADQPLVGLGQKMHPGYNDWLFQLCDSKGFVPHISSYFRTVRSLMFSLDMQDKIFIGVSITKEWCNDKLKAFELPALSCAIFAYRKNNTHEAADFREYFIERFRQSEQLRYE